MKQWAFPSAEHIGIKGFNDIGEEFKDNPISHLFGKSLITWQKKFVKIH